MIAETVDLKIGLVRHINGQTFVVHDKKGHPGDDYWIIATAYNDNTKEWTYTPICPVRINDDRVGE